MTVTMPSPDRVEALSSWSIRVDRPVDLDQIHDLHREAFHRVDEAELVDAIRRGPDFLPELSLVAATEDGTVLGHILLSTVSFEPGDVDAPREEVLALAPLAVLPQHQASGIGSALMREALAIADRRDERFVVVLGSPAFYGRFGFERADAYGITGPFEHAGDAFQVRRRAGGSDLVAGAVLYPPKFEAV